VAAATAVAADAAVAAAHAATTVVQLMSSGFSFISEGHSEEEYAAIRIQTTFRGYLVCANAIVVFNCILGMVKMIKS
jgi:hypothetical protein